MKPRDKALGPFSTQCNVGMVTGEQTIEGSQGERRQGEESVRQRGRTWALHGRHAKPDGFIRSVKDRGQTSNMIFFSVTKALFKHSLPLYPRGCSRCREPHILCYEENG